MENTLEIQKEFEILVSELERLKSINELTSSNANSAEKVIIQIEKIVASVEQFKERIDRDIKHKNAKIESILKQLEDAVLTIVESTNKSINELSNNLMVLQDKSDAIIKKNQQNQKVELSKFVDTLSNLSDSITLKIDSSFSKISNELLDQKVQINNEIVKNSILLESHLNALEKNTADDFITLQKLFEQNGKLIKQNRAILLFSTALTLVLFMLVLGHFYIH